MPAFTKNKGQNRDFANRLGFPAGQGFAKIFCPTPLYPLENKGPAERLKRVPR